MTDRVLLFERARQARARRFLTNCYSTDLLEKVDRIWENGDSFVFSYEDHGVCRLVFFVDAWETLDNLLEDLDPGRWFLEFMTRDPKEYVPRGGKTVTRMLRMANPDCRSVFDPASPLTAFRNEAKCEMAQTSDAEEITALLWNVFRPEISHLLYENEMRELIRAGQITVHRTEGRIDALLQAEVLPKKFYINQVVNRGERRFVHAMLLSRLEQYVEAGGKYLYAWVEENNMASRRFHGKYGMEHDGMFSMIYLIKK